MITTPVPAPTPQASDPTSIRAPSKGTYAGMMLATKDLDGTFERLQAANADIVQEPTEQDWGARDCAVRDPAGNLIRVQELRS